jgi:hypothetical protein
MKAKFATIFHSYGQQSTLLDCKKCNTIYMNVQLPGKAKGAFFFNTDFNIYEINNEPKQY